MALPIFERLNELSDSDWMTAPPANPDSLERLEKEFHFRLPADYRGVMMTTSGFGLYGHRTQFNLESADDVLSYNEDFAQDLPGMFVIGNDNGDAVFYYDPENRLGKGAWALFQVDLSMIGFPYSKYAAASLTQLIEAILANEEIWEYPYLGPLSHPDRA